MSALDHLAHLLLALLAAIIGIVLGVLAAIEGWLRHVLTALHIPPNLQTVVMILVAVAFLIAALRLFGGVIRIVLILLLVLILAHMLGAMPHHAGDVRL